MTGCIFNAVIKNIILRFFSLKGSYLESLLSTHSIDYFQFKSESL